MSRSIRNYNPDTEDLSWNIRDYDSVEDDFNPAEFYEGQENFDVTVAERNGEIIGYAAYGQKDGHGILDLIEVRPGFRGFRKGDKTVSKDLAEHAFCELEENNSAVMIQAKALEGPVQSIAEDYGYEISGFQIESDMETDDYESDIKQEVWDQGYSGGGFTAELWKLDEEITLFSIDAYLSSEVRKSASASLPEQVEVDYLVPGFEGRGDIEYDGVPSVGHGAVAADICRGEKTPKQIVSELTSAEEQDKKSWIHAVDLDLNDPVSYGVSEGLAENDWFLINVSPDVGSGNATATMVRPKKNTGSYKFTPSTQEFVEATGLPFRIDEEGQKSNSITFNPESEREVDPDTASEEEINRFYQKIAASD